MLRSNKGFLLLELLLSLSAFLVLCLYMLPLVMEIRDQSQQIQIERTARRLMYEELQAKLINNNQPFSNYALIVDMIEYKINWNNHGPNEQKEVCVTVEKDSHRREINVCGILE